MEKLEIVWCLSCALDLVIWNFKKTYTLGGARRKTGSQKEQQNQQGIDVWITMWCTYVQGIDWSNTNSKQTTKEASVTTSYCFAHFHEQLWWWTGKRSLFVFQLIFFFGQTGARPHFPNPLLVPLNHICLWKPPRITVLHLHKSKAREQNNSWLEINNLKLQSASQCRCGLVADIL